MARSATILEQTPVIASILRTAAVAAARQAGVLKPTPQPVPSPTLARTVPPRKPAHVKEYVRAVGGEPSWYRGVLPPHLFPQWGFPLWARTLEGAPYDITKGLNGGCRMEIRSPLPLGEPLHLRARLAEVDDNGRRAVLTQEMVTGTDSAPDALVSHLYVIIPLKGGKGAKKKKKAKPRVPEAVHPVARWHFTPETAWEFAVLTGDFNPIHWIRPAARAAGFRGTILHGFATLAYALEGLNRARFSGDPSRLASVDVRFTRPLVLPARVGLFLDDAGGFYVGDSPGGPAYLTGQYETRS